jgi:dephospho-CoA kinase
MKYVPTYEQFLQKLNEGVNDPSIFKAIFLAGGPGSGKSFVVNKVTGGLGYKIVNVDDIYEIELKKHGLKTTPEDIFSPKGQEIRGRAKDLTTKLADNYIAGRLGLIIDGTGKDFDKIKVQSDALKELGYETYMVFVNTSLDVALERNEKRARTLKPSLVEKMWRAVQDNIGKFQNYFGSNNFIIVDNNNADESSKAVFDKVWKQIMLLSRKPVRNRIARNWIDSNK